MLVSPPEPVEFGQVEFELFATTDRYCHTASGTIPFVVVSRNFAPRPGDLIQYYEIDSKRTYVGGGLKTGNYSILQIVYVEPVTKPWYVVGVVVRCCGSIKDTN